MLRTLTLLPIVVGLLFTTSTNIHVGVCNPATPVAPVIESPQDGTTTHDPTITVSGSSQDISYPIDIVNNGATVATTTTDASGAFGVSIPLDVSANQITAVADNMCGQTAASGAVGVTYTLPTPVTPPSSTPSTPAVPVTPLPSLPDLLPTPPVVPPVTSGPLTLSIFANKTISTTEASLSLRGKTSIAADVDISDNGRTVSRTATTNDGSFEVLVPLQMGANRVVVTATAKGRTASAAIEVTRIKPAIPNAKPDLTPVVVTVVFTLVLVPIVLPRLIRLLVLLGRK